jgi:peptide deformylase
MILKIVKFPDPVLQQPGEPVTEFDAELRKLAADMFETMYASQGIGLAAPQVGVSKRVTVIDLSQGKDPAQKTGAHQPRDHLSRGKAIRGGRLPQLSRDSRESGARGQGAHSCPGREWQVVRDGRRRAAGARFQHEIDHLDGMLFIFRMSALKRDLNLRKIRKMQRDGTWW